jgi:hypothetical protein
MATPTKILAAIGLIVTAFTASASADTYQHIDQLALKIDRAAKAIVCETRHYRHTPEYTHLVADARDLAVLADHVHEIAHHHGSLAHLDSDVAALDAKFHHLESVFDRVEWRAAHGHGHVHGNTSHVKGLLNSIEECIHHLQADLRSLRTPVHAVRPVVVQRPIYTTPHSSRWGGYNVRPHSSGFGNWSGHAGHNAHGYGSRGRSISIGGGSSRFTFRF